MVGAAPGAATILTVNKLESAGNPAEASRLVDRVRSEYIHERFLDEVFREQRQPEPYRKRSSER